MSDVYTGKQTAELFKKKFPGQWLTLFIGFNGDWANERLEEDFDEAMLKPDYSHAVDLSENISGNLIVFYQQCVRRIDGETLTRIADQWSTCEAILTMLLAQRNEIIRQVLAGSGKEDKK